MEVRGSRVGLLGAGKVGLVLALCLQRSGYHIAAVWDHRDAGMERARRHLAGASPAASARAVVEGSDIVLLTVPDDALEGFSERIAAEAEWLGRTAVHCSGRYGTGVLRALSGAGADVVALHPAMAFTGDIAVEATRVRGAHFAVTGSPEAVAVGYSLVTSLGAVPFEVAEDDRVLYHCAMSLGSSFISTLTTQAAQLLRICGVDEVELVLRPLLTASLDNALTAGVRGISGPTTRGDIGTVSQHLEALVARAPFLIDLYRAMATATVTALRDGGRLSEEDGRRFDAVLRTD